MAEKSTQYDFYKILGVSRNSSYQVIKHSYRVKAKRYHPDVNDDPKAHELFALVNEAYQTLGDRTKRRRYDFELRTAYRKNARTNSTGPSAGPAQRARKRSPKNPLYQKADTLRNRPVLYNSLFIFGMFVGGLVFAIGFSIFLYADGMPKIAIIITLPGFILIRDGWRGLTWKRQLLQVPLVAKIRDFFRIDLGNDA